MARTVCSECDTEQAVKTDGTFRKHNSNGDVCPGSGRRPDMDVPVEAEPDLSAEPTPEPAPPPEPEPAGGDHFEWPLTVSSPCIYLDDQAWHLANLRMAARKAEEAGHTPTGEGHYAGETAKTDRSVTLTYRVPVAP